MMKGLSTAQASERLKKFGFNELQSTKSKSLLQITLEVIKEPMFILLISCASLYLILDETREGIILLCSVFVIIFITFYQHQKTERALEKLKSLSSPRAMAIRDGTAKRISGREVVPGDWLILNEGDRIAADGTLRESHQLLVDESLLTGEAVPVQKNNNSENPTQNKVYSGTLVVQGSGVMTVSGTGSHTEFGKIGSSLAHIESEPTQLQKEMKVLIRNLFLASFFFSLLLIAAFYLTRGQFVQALLNGLAGAMAMLPEEFPVVFTVFLALGSWRLSRKNVLTRKPSAIETLGAATVLCSDKTGTITQNKMDIDSLYCRGTQIQKSSFAKESRIIQEIVSISFLASQKNAVDPMEKAIEKLYLSLGDKEIQEGIPHKEYPLTQELLAMTKIYKNANQTYLACCKGAPEAVLSLCSLQEKTREALQKKIHELTNSGKRVIAVAKAEISGTPLPAIQEGLAFEFVGFISFEDPIRPEVPEAVQQCYDAGIKVIMITGDYPSTAKNIAQQAGIKVTEHVLTGTDLKTISDDELQERIKEVNVFARIVPEQKLQIIRALKANGEIVAMTGDGVNDAPALKAADIGIAMGKKGTDVAREASSLVLLDDNFSSIVSAIRLGRKIFDNLQKAMTYIFAIHIPIIGLTLLPAFFSSLPILLMPLHIVFMELIIDPACSVAFESEKEETGIMERPPRAYKQIFFGFWDVFFSIMRGFLLLGMVMGVYFMTIKEGHTQEETRLIAFTSLIIGNIFLILTTISKTRSVFSVVAEKNWALLFIVLMALLLLLVLNLSPYLKGIFGFSYPGLKHLAISFLGAFGVLFILETLKLIRNTPLMKKQSNQQ